MNKDVPRCLSTFTLTFAIEIIDLETWEDFKEGTLELGPCVQGVKLQYQLYYGQNFDIDVAIWPHTAKIICGSESCWVRTWRFLQRYWLTFSIRHAFPVWVQDLRDFEAIVIPSVGVGAKTDKSAKVYFPPLTFGQRRYFAPVFEDLLTEREKLIEFVQKLIWGSVEQYIPTSYLDGKFDVPYPVIDIRHQDAIFSRVQETTLNRDFQTDDNTDTSEENNVQTRKTSLRDNKPAKNMDNKKKGDAVKNRFGVRLSGDTILAGTGRIVPFETFGERPPELGEIIIIISSCNLPAQDDLPIAFVNIDTLFDAPLEEFKKLRITHLYTRWTLGDEIHDSKPVDITSTKIVKDVQFNDHHALPLEISKATEVTAFYLDSYYEIELRGIRPSVPSRGNATLFGYEIRDREFGNAIPPEIVDEELDFLIATTRMDARTLARGINAFIRGEYPLYPPILQVPPLPRDSNCTNDINMIGASLRPHLIVPTSVILMAQMTIQISMGVVGCKPPRLTSCFSRLYFLCTDPDSIMVILFKVGEINDVLSRTEKEEMLTGFALDTGDILVFFLEGPRDRYILRIWELTEEHYPKVKPVFSSSARYSSRVYGGLMQSVPFVVLKMYVPLQILLAVPSVYARPALPVPARSAALKFGRLIQNWFRVSPPLCELPTVTELRSFRLELCAPPRTFPVIPHNENTAEIDPEKLGTNTTAKINWRK